MERVAIGLNPNMPVRDVINIAKEAENNNFDSVWVHENPFIRDVVNFLSGIALSTSKIKFASGCISAITRLPILTASTFASLGELSNGRAILGFGLGGFPWLPKIGYKVFPVQETKPLLRLKEYLQIVAPLLRGESVSLQGKFYTANELKLEWTPKKVPIYLASYGQKILKALSPFVDGVIISPALMTPEETAKRVAFVAQNGKKDIASYILCSVSDDPKQAREAAKKYYFLIYQLAEVIKAEVLAKYGVKDEDLQKMREAWKKRDIPEAAKAIPDEAIEALTISGTPDQCLARMRDYQKVGVDLPILMPIGDMPQAVQALGKHIL
jgi:5,10-methylenetetrahydromethanopterin reductase